MGLLIKNKRSMLKPTGGLGKVTSPLRTPNIAEYKKGGFRNQVSFNYLYQMSKKT